MLRLTIFLAQILALLFSSLASADSPFVTPTEIKPATREHPLARAVLDRDQTEAVRLVQAGISLDLRIDESLVDNLLPRRARMGSDKAGYPLAIAAAALGLPGVLSAIGERAPEVLHVTDSDNKTAINYAAQQGYAKSVAVLLRYGLNPLQPPRGAWASGTPLSRAVAAGHVPVVKLLLDAIPAAQYASERVTEQVWSMTFPQFQDHMEVLHLLLEAGISPNYIAPQGGTALINAIENQNPAQVRLLIRHGAIAFSHHYRGRSAHEWAAYYAGGDASSNAREIAGLVGALKIEPSSWQKDRVTEKFEQTMRLIESPGSSEKR